MLVLVTIDRGENRRRAFLRLRGVEAVLKSMTTREEGGATHAYIYTYTDTHATSSCRGGQRCWLGCHRDE